MFSLGSKKKKIKIALKKEGHVHRDWAIALIVFVVALIGIVATNAFIFLKTIEVGVVAIEEVEQEKLIDEELLTNTIELFSEKEARYTRYQQEIPQAPDL